MKLNITFQNKQVTEEIKREIKKLLETNDNENMTTENQQRKSNSKVSRK